MDPDIRPFTGDSPVMGIHLGLRGPNGTVRLGDPVYVGISNEEETSVISPPQLHRWASCEDEIIFDEVNSLVGDQRS